MSISEPVDLSTYWILWNSYFEIWHRPSSNQDSKLSGGLMFAALLHELTLGIILKG